jgi:hypothetical protein
MSARMGVWKVGLILGAVIGGLHLCWSILVALDCAQPVIDFIFWMHFIKPIYMVEPFEIARAVILPIITAGTGFMIGSAFAFIWNALYKA